MRPVPKWSILYENGQNLSKNISISYFCHFLDQISELLSNQIIADMDCCRRGSQFSALCHKLESYSFPRSVQSKAETAKKGVGGLPEMKKKRYCTNIAIYNVV